MNEKNVFAENLKWYMSYYGKSRKEVSAAIGVSYFTFTDWVKGRSYPRMDKVDKLAAYFGILKSDLIEEKTEADKRMQKKNDTITDIIITLRTDDGFFDLVKKLHGLDAKQRESVQQSLTALLNAFDK